MKTTYSFFTKLCLVMALLTMSVSSCKKFLDVKPSKGQGTIISTTDQLQALLNNYADYFKVNDNISLFGSDDNGLSTALYDARPFGFSATTIQFSTWDNTYLPQNDQGSFFSGPNLWSGEYAKIFNANTVLTNVDNVTGSVTDKAALIADAHFIRAYSYWQLANTYCLPYSDATKGEPGLPIKTTPDYQIVPRSTLADTYAQIAADLNEALKTTVSLTQGGVNRSWRANTAGVNGFAARFYLNQNDYTNALKYANASLAMYSTLVDYNSDMRYGNSATATINSGTPSQQTVTIKFPYTHDGDEADVTNAISWKEMLYFRVLKNKDQWFIPSQSLLNLYDVNNDLRYKYHYIQNFSYTKGFVNPALSYPGYVFFGNYGVPQGPTVAEMILIKAECQARTGDFNSAMATVNQLYSKRTVTGTAPLTATSQAQAITIILQERRREMPFSERWFDVRRFNTNSDPNDDVPVLSRAFYPYNQYSVLSSQPVKTFTLPKGSRRFASPLPQSDVDNSNGLIKQNIY